MSFLRAEPSKKNTHTCKDKPFHTTPTSVLLMEPMHSRSPFSAQHFWAFGGSALKMGDKRTSGLSSVDVRRFMPCELAENRSVLSARAFPELSTPWMDLVFRKKRCLKIRCLNSRTVVVTQTDDPQRDPTFFFSRTFEVTELNLDRLSW
jgi:hypothetical protein